MERPTHPTPKTATFEFSGGQGISAACASCTGGRLTDSGSLGDRSEPGSNTATQQTGLVERRFGVDSYDRHVRYDSVLREGRGAHL